MLANAIERDKDVRHDDATGAELTAKFMPHAVTRETDIFTHACCPGGEPLL